MTVSESLRAAIQASGLSLYQIAVNAELGYAQIHGFAAGERDLSLGAVDRLCCALGLKLVKAGR